MERTEEDIESDYVRDMGAELGLLYSLLSNECALIHLIWGEYLVLFGLSDVNVELLHYTGSMTLWGKLQPIYGAALLLDVLKDGLKADEKRRDRLLNGCPLPDDFD